MTIWLIGLNTDDFGAAVGFDPRDVESLIFAIDRVETKFHEEGHTLPADRRWVVSPWQRKPASRPEGFVREVFRAWRQAEAKAAFSYFPEEVL